MFSPPLHALQCCVSMPPRLASRYVPVKIRRPARERRTIPRPPPHDTSNRRWKDTTVCHCWRVGGGPKTGYTQCVFAASRGMKMIEHLHGSDNPWRSFNDYPHRYPAQVRPKRQTHDGTGNDHIHRIPKTSAKRVCASMDSPLSE